MVIPRSSWCEGLPDHVDSDDGTVHIDEEMQSKRVFPRAMVVAGVLHITHNLSLKMVRFMQLWDWWLSGLQALVTLLHYKHNREAFIKRCVNGTFVKGHRTLRSGVGTTADWRWNTVEPIVKKRLLMQPVLQATFKAPKMTGIKSDSEGEVEGENRDKVGKLNPTKVESTIKKFCVVGIHAHDPYVAQALDTFPGMV